jgi:hypothetical protein
MTSAAHPGLKRELGARKLSANRLALNLGARRDVSPTSSTEMNANSASALVAT